MTVRLFLTRGALLGVLAMMWSGLAAAADEPVVVSLKIENGMANGALRCQLVLAHFVTVGLAPIPAGQRLAVALTRDAAGALFYQAGEGPLMAIENVLCGRDDDWAATRQDLNLTTLRGPGVPAARIVCAGDNVHKCRTSQ